MILPFLYCFIQNVQKMLERESLCIGAQDRVITRASWLWHSVAAVGECYRCDQSCRSVEVCNQWIHHVFSHPQLCTSHPITT